MAPRRRSSLTRLWEKTRWLPWLALALGFFGALAYLSLASTESRWRLTSSPPGAPRGSPNSWLVYTEKLVPRARARAFAAAYPGAALDWLSSLGLSLPDPRSQGLVTFAAWGGYTGIQLDDPLIVGRLKPRKDGSLVLISRMATDFRLNEPVASSFVTADATFLFLDLTGDAEEAALHGLAHVLARSHLPPALKASLDPKAPGSNKAATDFRFVDEVAALFLSDAYSAGAFSQAAQAGRASLDLGKYEAYLARRYAPDGPIMTDANLTFAFTSDPRSPASFAAAARFADAALRARGEAAFLSWIQALLSGSYNSLDELCAPLGGGLGEVLARFLGSPETPE